MYAGKPYYHYELRDAQYSVLVVPQRALVMKGKLYSIRCCALHRRGENVIDVMKSGGGADIGLNKNLDAI
eukprot:scaffold314121_cov41-Prasinocladus_malaysianus.AAC.1